MTPELQDSASLRFLSYSGIIYEKAGHNSMHKHTPFDTLCWVRIRNGRGKCVSYIFATEGVHHITLAMLVWPSERALMAAATTQEGVRGGEGAIDDTTVRRRASHQQPSCSQGGWFCIFVVLLTPILDNNAVLLSQFLMLALWWPLIHFYMQEHFPPSLALQKAFVPNKYKLIHLTFGHKT